jgi:N utilization substance protein A
MRIQNIVKELNEEKIDVIEWNTDSSIFIAKSLSPARVTGVYLEEDVDQGNTATVIVPDDQLSLAIGREGQNARLAAKLTGWRIDIKSVSEAAFAAQASIDQPPLAKLAQDQADMVADVNRILDKKRNERTVTPEEYHTLARFVQMAEVRLLEAREAEHVKRRKLLDQAKASIPKRAFLMPLEELELEKEIVTAFKARNVLSVGDLMTRLSAEPDNLRGIVLHAGGHADDMEAIQAAITSLVTHDGPDAIGAEAAAETESVVALEAAQGVEGQADMTTATVSIAEPSFPDPDEYVDDEAPPAFPDDIAPMRNLAPQPEAPKLPKGVSRSTADKPPRFPRAVPPPVVAEAAPGDAEGGSDADSKNKDARGKKGGKDRQRELVFDEGRNQVVARKKRKRTGQAWDSIEDEE